MGVSASAVARVLGIDTIFKNLRISSIVNLPQRIALIGQGATASVYSTVKAQFTSALAVGQTYGFGSPLHLASQQLLPANGDGIGTIPLTIYALQDDGAGVVSDGDITPSGVVTAAASYIVRVNEIDSAAFTIAIGDSVATIVTAMVDAINAELDVPIIAVDGVTDVTFTSKWKGVSANDIVVEIIGVTTAGISYAITQANGGLVNPDVDLATAQVGAVWETLILNCMEIADTVTLGKFTTWGDGRWGALVRKPAVVFTGNLNTTVANATAVSDARKTDRVNAQLVAPGSINLPFVVAARQLARIAVRANDNPPYDYGSMDASGLVPGTDAEQWTNTDRDEAIKKGSSSIQVKDGVVNLSDTVTFYHPDGDTTPAYRYVVDIIKLQNIIFNFDLEFAQDKWDGAPLIPDNQPTTNPSAVKPKTAVAAMAAIVDNLALAAIISDPDAAKDSITAEIDGANPKRLNQSITVQLSGNSNIISMDLNFGFFFGTAAIVA